MIPFTVWHLSPILPSKVDAPSPCAEVEGWYRWSAATSLDWCFNFYMFLCISYGAGFLGTSAKQTCHPCQIMKTQHIPSGKWRQVNINNQKPCSPLKPWELKVAGIHSCLNLWIYSCWQSSYILLAISAITCDNKTWNIATACPHLFVKKQISMSLSDGRG